MPIHKKGEWGASYEVTGKGEDPLIHRPFGPLAVIWELPRVVVLAPSQLHMLYGVIRRKHLLPGGIIQDLKSPGAMHVNYQRRTYIPVERIPYTI